MPSSVAPVIALLVSTSAWAQVSPISPFTGERQEGFEAFAMTSSAVPCLPDAFSGHADVCAPDAAVGGMNVRPSYFYDCQLFARTGQYHASSNDGPVEITFAAPVERFKNYFGTHAHDGDLTLVFFDVDDQEIGRHTAAFGGACVWAWRGYEATGTPIARVRLLHSDHGGAQVDMDDLRITTPCGLSDLDCDGSVAGADCDDLDARRTPGNPEVCDGVDSDCDDTTPSDEVDGDGDGHLACSDCDDADAAVHPGAFDDCGGGDEDCSGVADDNPQSPPLADLQDGVCVGSTQVCGTAGFVEPDYTELSGFESVESSCDDQDNDCNGDVDDITDPPGVGPPFGVCLDLVPECLGAAGWSEPTDWGSLVAWETVELTCDGLDNDCDGEVDEDLDAPDAVFTLGVCVGARQVCAGSNGWIEPDFTAIADFDLLERCDGLDNDCNGAVDDDCEEVDDGGSTACGCASPGSPPAGFGLWFGLLALYRRRLTASRHRPEPSPPSPPSEHP